LPVDPNRRRFDPAHGNRQHGTNVKGKIPSSFILTHWRETSQYRRGSTIRWIGKMQIMHFAIYNTYSGTDMSHSTSLPTKAIEAGWLSTPREFFNQNTNRHYKVWSRQSKVFETEYELDSDGREVFNHTEELAYIVGTGVNGATPIVRRGNYLFQAPISY